MTAHFATGGEVLDAVVLCTVTMKDRLRASELPSEVFQEVWGSTAEALVRFLVECHRTGKGQPQSVGWQRPHYVQLTEEEEITRAWQPCFVGVAAEVQRRTGWRPAVVQLGRQD